MRKKVRKIIENVSLQWFARHPRFCPGPPGVLPGTPRVKLRSALSHFLRAEPPEGDSNTLDRSERVGGFSTSAFEVNKLVKKSFPFAAPPKIQSQKWSIPYVELAQRWDLAHVKGLKRWCRLARQICLYVL